MGLCAKAMICYGFILSKEQVAQLHIAHQKHARPNITEDEYKPLCMPDFASELEDSMSDDVYPFIFRVATSGDSHTRPRGERVFAFCYDGMNSDDGCEEVSESVEAWGTEGEYFFHFVNSQRTDLKTRTIGSADIRVISQDMFQKCQAF